ncbi:MAG: polyhydroxyalkanoate synthesis repressor PhaR [Rhodomicrobiaceae bacterium]
MVEESQIYKNGFSESAPSFEADAQPEKPVIVIKKYANRRLYNTDTSTYVTLDDLAEMVRAGDDFVVYDARTTEDLTHAVLTQIIVEQESKGQQNLLPIGFLRQLIRFYGNSIERLVPSYLEYSLDTLTRDQEQYRQQFANTFGGAAIEAMQEQTRKNLEIFQNALNMFAPFTAFEQKKPGVTEPPKNAAPASAEKKADRAQTDEIAELKTQLASIQLQLNKLADQNK